MNKNLFIIILMSMVLGLVFISFEMGMTVKSQSLEHRLLEEQYDNYDFWYKNNPELRQVIPEIINASSIQEKKEGFLIKGEYEIYQAKGTNSMLPLLGKGSHVLAKPYNGSYELQVGNIIIYNASMIGNSSSERLSHRIINKGEDEKGTYYLTKGDNCLKQDPWKVRKKHVDSVITAIIY